MSHESDRGCVLIAAAWVDDQLRVLIGNIFKDLNDCGVHPVAAKEFDALNRSILDGCFGKSVNRVNFCRLIGAIDSPTAAAMAALFQLRNEHFAHFAGVSELSDSAVAPKLSEFIESVVEAHPNPASLQNTVCGPGLERLRFTTAFESLRATTFAAETNFFKIAIHRRLRSLPIELRPHK
ncbi:hypothetical protein [Lacipirellula parvula]|uniref:hypothetical protein n=1 Tax=Lacipirellula parvula TaxID=2650471 RepID=UPI0012608B13|nr:hypothetical protein [Lacipirellula parvula]